MNPWLTELLQHIVADVLTKLLMYLASRMAGSAFGDDISYAIEERVDRKSAWSGLLSAFNAFFEALNFETNRRRDVFVTVAFQMGTGTIILDFFRYATILFHLHDLALTLLYSLSWTVFSLPAAFLYRWLLLQQARGCAVGLFALMMGLLGIMLVVSQPYSPLLDKSAREPLGLSLFVFAILWPFLYAKFGIIGSGSPTARFMRHWLVDRVLPLDLPHDSSSQVFNCTISAFGKKMSFRFRL